MERETELVTLESRLAEARGGAGGVIYIDAPAGNGKSRLLTIAGDLAREAGMHVLGAQGTELERDFPFGVAIQLFEPRWLAADPEARERLLEGPARWAAELLSGSSPGTGAFPGDQGYALIHGLFWVARNLTTPADEGTSVAPLVMLVDDAHLADRPSLRFLAYLAERVTELPIVLVVGAREGEPCADRRALLALRNAAEDAVLEPGSLSGGGVGAIVRSEFPNADPAFCQACYRTTNGNPFLLVELLAQLRVQGLPPDGTTAARLADLAPESVLNSIVPRLESMPEEHRVLATAVAVLGDGAPLSQVAQLARLDIEATARAADGLAAIQLLHPGAPLSFVHPLIREAVKASISPFERARAHRRAAEILTAAGAPEEQTAIHLLEAPPEADPSTVEVLRAAARKARASGAAESAMRMLERALCERLRDRHPELISELAEAELAAGFPEQGITRLQQAIDLTQDPRRRTELALIQADALHGQARYREASEVLAAALEGCVPEQAEELEAAYVAAASMVGELADQARAQGERLLERLGSTPSDRQRVALAHIAVGRAMRGEERAAVTDVADLAFGEGALLDGEPGERPSWPLLTGALVIVDELERSLELCDLAASRSRGHDPAAMRVTASYCRAWPLYLQGRIGEALAQAKIALDADPEPWQSYLRSASGVIAACQLQSGQLAQAERALSILDDAEVWNSIHGAYLLDIRAQLRLAQLRPEAALADALEAGRRLESEFGLDNPAVLPWRSTAAAAHLALGDDDSVRQLAGEELERARAGKLMSVMIRDLRILGMAERGEDSLKLLEQAVAIGARHPVRLEYMHALVDLGAALRRANRRTDAREPLRKGLELSHRGGAEALAARARTELHAAGSRPRREMLTGIESLTPSELRVGELAAAGLTTRQVAEALFVSPKTVEFHLRGAYRKLGVSSRDELAGALRGAPSQAA